MLKLTRDEVEKGIDEARAWLKAAQASLKLAEIEYARFTRLEQQGASMLQRQQQMTQSRDSALAQVDLNQARLAKAVASLTQIDVARRTLESAQKSALKAVNRYQPRRGRPRPDPRAGAAGQGQGAGVEQRDVRWKPPRMTSSTRKSERRFPESW